MNRPIVRYVLIVLAIIFLGAFLTLKPAWLKLPACPFHEQTGIYCPGCGSTRSLTRLFHGDVLGAFRYNVIAPPTFALAFWLFVVGEYDRWRGVFVPRGSTIALATAWLIVAIVFMILRNLPFECFDLLRPPT